MMFFLISILLWGGLGDSVAAEASPLKRSQLPDGFPLRVLDSGFAVVQLRIENQSSQPWDFDPTEVLVTSPKGKKLKRALPTDIAPKLRKFHAGNRRGIHGITYDGDHRPTPGEMERAPAVDPNVPPGVVSADLGTQLRRLLEGFELQPTTLQPGQSIEGLLYYKSKVKGAGLYDGMLQLGDGTKALLQPAG